jgi:hypothetical protein
MQRGPKKKDIYHCTCCEPSQEFNTSKAKCDHEFKGKRKAQSMMSPSIAGSKAGSKVGTKD